MERISSVEDIVIISEKDGLQFNFSLLFNSDKSKGKIGYYLRLTPSEISKEGLLKRKYSEITRDVLILSVDYHTQTKLKEAIMIRERYVREIKEELIQNSDFIEEIKLIMDNEKELRNENSKKIDDINKSESNDKTFIQSEKPNVKFDDVAGLKEAKEELYEIVDAITNKEEYKKMGAKLPGGVLLYGPPGTGKTFLAKAIAGETKATFFNVSGSEFVEKYVGIGAKRVRDLFKKAKKQAPSIIFIDEIDAIGVKRSGESNAETDKTLNQLLVELDGFDEKDDVIVIGATNRVEILDSALKRPGRLGKHIYIGNPDLESRKELFEIHTKNKPLNTNVNLEELAKKTHGFSGADIESITNESALLAVRQKRSDISQENLEDALEKVISGLSNKSKKLREKEKMMVSYHESGHALVGMLLDINKIQKISIIPHGQALGFVINLPEEDKYLSTKIELENEIKMLLAGRVAEEIKFGNYSTGASDDLKKATKIATRMICYYGMDENVGLFTREISSMDKLTTLERESINSILYKAYNETKELLENNIDKLEKIAEYLCENEEMNSSDMEKLFKDDLDMVSIFN